MPKAASTETAMPTLGSAKSSGSSFLDILLNGIGVGVQAMPAASARQQSSSQANPFDRSTTDDEPLQTTTPTAETSASSSTDSPAPTQAQLGNEPGTSLVQPSGASDGSGGSQVASTSQPVDPDAGISAILNAAQSFQNNASQLTTAVAAVNGTPANAAMPTITATKTPVDRGHAKPSATDAKRATEQAQALSIQTVPVAAPAAAPVVVPVKPAATPSPISSIAPVLTNKPTEVLNAAESSANQPSAQPAHEPQVPVQQDPVPAAQNTQPAVTPLEVAPRGSTQNVPANPQDSTPNDQSGTQDGTASLPVAQQSVPAPVSTFLSAALFPNGLGLPQSATKVMQFKSSGTTSQAPNAANPSSSTLAPTNPAGTAKNNAQDSTGSNTRNGQSNADGVQRTQADSTPPVNTVVKAGESTSPQTVAFGTLLTSHEPSARAATGAGDDTAHIVTTSSSSSPDPANAVEAGASSPINSARVLQSMSESEMRVGMRSIEFGDISIRTMVSQQQVQAQISVDHSELSSAISAHIPSIQAKFGNDLGLHATIEVNQSGMSFSGERGQSAPREQRSFVPSIQTDSPILSTETESLAVRATPLTVDDSRLDIRA